MTRRKITLFIILFFLLTSITFFFLRIFPIKQKDDSDIPTLLAKTATNLTKKLTKKNPPLSQINHVFVVLEENHDWQTIYNNSSAPFINKTLLTQGAYASNYHNIPTNMGELHPSELNYIFLEAGMVTFPDYTFTTDNDPSAKNSTSSINHFVTLLEKNGYTWKSYQEGISGNDCPIITDNNYAPKHNPFLYFQNVSGNPPSTANLYCKEHIRPIAELDQDIKTGNLPNYVFITPNLEHDMHNGTIAQADTWLSQIVPTITNSSRFKKDGALFITWDEGTEENSNDKQTGGNNPIGMIMLSPFIKKGYTNTIEYSHASFLKTIEEIFHTSPLLGLTNDPKTKSLSDFFIIK